MRETEDEEEETEQNRMISPDSRDMGGKRDMYHKPFVLDWFCISGYMLTRIQEQKRQSGASVDLMSEKADDTSCQTNNGK